MTGLHKGPSKSSYATAPTALLDCIYSTLHTHTRNPEHHEELHCGRFVVANTHKVKLLQAVRQILAHLLVISIQRLDVLHT